MMGVGVSAIGDRRRGATDPLLIFSDNHREGMAASSAPVAMALESWHARAGLHDGDGSRRATSRSITLHPARGVKGASPR
jgi:hypothetical protein